MLKKQSPINSWIVLASTLWILALCPTAQAEKAPLPMEGLKQLPLAFVGTVTARSDSTSGIPILTETTTRITLTFTVDRVLRDENASGIAVGAPFTVGAFEHSNSFLGGTNASGNSTVPIVGDRVRVFASNDVESCHPADLKWAVEYPNGFQPSLRIGFFSGDDEYRSEITMPMIAKSLSKELSIDCPTVDVPKKDPPSYCMISMRRADAIVFFMRWRDLSSSDCEEIEEALGSGLPIVGLRTSTHAFAMPAKSQWHWMNDGFPLQVWGQKWLTHHGHTSKTRVLAVDGSVKDHPILRGITGNFEVPSWLYCVEPLPSDAKVLLWGESINSEQGAEISRRQPILWVRERSVTKQQRAAWWKERMKASSGAEPNVPQSLVPSRMAFCTLGHPGDFENVQVRRIVEQMILWAADHPEMIPADGLKCEIPAEWSAPATR